MHKKTRYLQISDIIMFEINLLGEGDDCNKKWPTSFLTTKLKDDHTLLYSPVMYECDKIINPETGEYSYKLKKDPLSFNTINHIAVPKDAQCSGWYTFLDPDYKYIGPKDDYAHNSSDDEEKTKVFKPNVENQIYYDQIKARQYGEHTINPTWSNVAPLENYYSSISDVRWDYARLYFVNGYDFSNIAGFLMRITVDCNEEGKYVDLCDFFITKASFYNIVQYMSSPIIFGNNIYDRYIEVSFGCLYDLIRLRDDSDANENTLFRDLDIKENTQIKLSFAYILDDEIEYDHVEYNEEKKEQIDYPTVLFDEPNCSFTRSSEMHGTVPTQEITSDNLGAYIAECTDMPFLVFYATWRDKPLTKGIVWQFNKGIRLYDTSLIKKDSLYDDEVTRDYEVNHDMKKWVCVHEIKCSFCMGEEIIKEETYTMNQAFISDTDPYMFYYRPIIFDEAMGMYIDNAQIVYTVRFMNVDDKVQFIKTATMSLYGDLTKYYAKGTSLKPSQMSPYKIYNKIVEAKQEYTGGNNGPQKTKYIRVFYNSTDVVLDDQGNVVNGNYNYTLPLSQAPKSYKFTFKITGPNGTYSYMDLSNGYYKLLFIDDGGNTNMIEPTYSNNMNLYVGELEFNLNSSMINKLNAVPEDDRRMSIVNYNEDGSVSSMFDFLYEV